MAINRTYGALEYEAAGSRWLITQCEPHISIKLKSVFKKIHLAYKPPYPFKDTPENCTDILWFMERYPLKVSEDDKERLVFGQGLFFDHINRLETIHMPGYVPRAVDLKPGEKARDYQLKGKETYIQVKRMMLGDDMGLGKTVTAILSFLEAGTIPGVVVCQAHLPTQWKIDFIERFTNLRVHIIKKTSPYDLPAADVYVFKYSCLAGWCNTFENGFFKSAIFDECQELRRKESLKYEAARRLSESVDYCMGMSATPVYNYGDEIFNILDLINPGCLGTRDEFLREWCVEQGRHHKVIDPKALGTYLRESFLFLRRTREDVGRELPAVNKIVHTVGYDEQEVAKTADLARALALKVMTGSFEERGMAARELDMMARHVTGVSKAKYVAEYVRILLENGLPVVLSGWHRDVYDIWMRELEEFKPVLYTGSESPKQKEAAKLAFINGDSLLFIISNRSGIGLDGLQHVCHDVVIGELDWSPEVMKQIIGRVDRDEQKERVTAHYLVSDFGSDPPILGILGLKASQAQGIVDPLIGATQQYSDESRIKLLAQQFIDKKQLKEQQSLF